MRGESHVSAQATPQSRIFTQKRNRRPVKLLDPSRSLENRLAIFR